MINKNLKLVMFIVLGYLAVSLIILGLTNLGKTAKECYLQQIGEKSVSTLNLKSNNFIIIYKDYDIERYSFTIKYSANDYENFSTCFDINKFIYYLEKNSIPYQVIDKTRSRRCKNS
jgi:hypothetical protein